MPTNIFSGLRQLTEKQLVDELQKTYTGKPLKLEKALRSCCASDVAPEDFRALQCLLDSVPEATEIFAVDAGALTRKMLRGNCGGAFFVFGENQMLDFGPAFFAISTLASTAPLRVRPDNACLEYLVSNASIATKKQFASELITAFTAKPAEFFQYLNAAGKEYHQCHERNSSYRFGQSGEDTLPSQIAKPVMVKLAEQLFGIDDTSSQTIKKLLRACTFKSVCGTQEDMQLEKFSAKFRVAVKPSEEYRKLFRHCIHVTEDEEKLFEVLTQPTAQATTIQGPRL